ncbi:TCO2 protein, partial [Turnix velox]|nr:TCO2 protein [Turnix velox]
TELPETGRLALYLLGLQATCSPPEHLRLLVTWLKHYLNMDWIGSRHYGHPLTSYYQYSLGVLALCTQHKRMGEEVIKRLLAAEHHDRFRQASIGAVDTEAVAALAFICLEKKRMVRPRQLAELQVAIRKIQKRMLEAQDTHGFFGNIYSTPLAMQVFIATNTCHTEPAYDRAMTALLKNLDALTTAHTMAQALPALHSRSYLDVASMSCQLGWRGEKEESQDGVGFGLPINGFLATGTPSAKPTPEVLENMITVTLVVECLPWCSLQHLYNQSVSVPAGTSLLGVLMVATNQETGNFTFDTEDTFNGPFLTRVMGLKAQQNHRFYWQLLSAPKTSLEMGVAEYKPKDKETIILRLSKW